jgi:hypothetical protein
MNRARIVLRQGQDCAPKGMRGSLTTMNITQSRTPRAAPITQTGTPLQRNVIIGGGPHRPRLVRSSDPRHASRRAHLLEFVNATLQQSRFETSPRPVKVASTPAECIDSRAEGLISAGSLDRQLTDKGTLGTPQIHSYSYVESAWPYRESVSTLDERSTSLLSSSSRLGRWR